MKKLPKPRKKQKYPELWMHKGSGDLIIHYDNENSIRYRDSNVVLVASYTTLFFPELELDEWDKGLMSRDRRMRTDKFVFIGELK